MPTQVQVENGTFKATSGRAATSYSNAGNTKKPMAIIEGTLNDAGTPYSVELHVHFDAKDPLDSFTGANARISGSDVTFATWPASAVSTKFWLRSLLDVRIPNWSKKSTWTAVDSKSEIVWQPTKVDPARFEEGRRLAARTANANYKVTFLIGKNQKADQQQLAVEKIVAGRATVTVGPGGPNWKAELTFTSEEAARVDLSDIAYQMRQRWPNTIPDHTMTVAWN